MESKVSVRWVSETEEYKITVREDGKYASSFDTDLVSALGTALAQAERLNVSGISLCKTSARRAEKLGKVAA